MKLCMVSSCGSYVAEARTLGPVYERYDHFYGVRLLRAAAAGLRTAAIRTTEALGGSALPLGFAMVDIVGRLRPASHEPSPQAQARQWLLRGGARLPLKRSVGAIMAALDPPYRLVAALLARRGGGVLVQALVSPGR